MASSDDEGEVVHRTAKNYVFLNEKEEYISLLELPVQWNKVESLDGIKRQIFLLGTIGNMLQKVYKQVIAWKFDISSARPHIFVLSKDNNWIKLQKPRRSYRDTIRSFLITVHGIHFLRRNPKSAGKGLWHHLSKVFRFCNVKPSEIDLLNHINLIREAVERDRVLAKSKFLAKLLENPRNKKAFQKDADHMPLSGFVVDDDKIDGKLYENEDDLFDTVCAICDNGGDLVCCEGRCLRSFHATAEAGVSSMCKSIGISDKEVETIQNFFCDNCLHKQHQCFVCGVLGPSDEASGAEVFSCASATCGHFYHPHCAAELLHCGNEFNAKKLEKKISAGEPFTCPVHKCYVCKEGENKMVHDLQFAICRRCPRSYHRKCLPRKIAFEDKGIKPRAWEGLFPNRILIYCLKHKIDDELSTPARNHIKFPNARKRKRGSAFSSREVVLEKEKDLIQNVSAEKPGGKLPTVVQKSSSAVSKGNSLLKNEQRSSGMDSSKRRGLMNASREISSHACCTKDSRPSKYESKTSLGKRFSKGTKYDKSGMELTTDSQQDFDLTMQVAREISYSSFLDDDSRSRILTLMEDVASSVTLDEIIEILRVPTIHLSYPKSAGDKGTSQTTLGKVESSIEALHAALQKLEEGFSIDDAKTVRNPGLLNQIIKWKEKLKVYLAPFGSNKCCTSYGQHFKKTEQLKGLNSIHEDDASIESLGNEPLEKHDRWRNDCSKNAEDTCQEKGKERKLSLGKVKKNRLSKISPYDKKGKSLLSCRSLPRMDGSKSLKGHLYEDLEKEGNLHSNHPATSVSSSHVRSGNVGSLGNKDVMNGYTTSSAKPISSNGQQDPDPLVQNSSHVTGHCPGVPSLSVRKGLAPDTACNSRMTASRMQKNALRNHSTYSESIFEGNTSGFDLGSFELISKHNTAGWLDE